MGVMVRLAERMPIAQDVLQRWACVPVAVIVDLHTSIRQIDPVIHSLLPAVEQPRLMGPAVTALCKPPDFGAVMHALEVLQAGDVLVISADGWSEHAMIGDILGGYLKSRNIAGVVCDGAVRDTATLAQWTTFPIFTRHVTPRGPVGAEEGVVNADVAIGNVVVKPADWIIGDADGLVVLSPEEMMEMIDAAEERVAKEADWQARLEQGELPSVVFGL
jgi:regulator of RNase E activity RraA